MQTPDVKPFEICSIYIPEFPPQEQGYKKQNMPWAYLGAYGFKPPNYFLLLKTWTV